MTGILASALVGFFVASNITVPTAAEALQVADVATSTTKALKEPTYTAKSFKVSMTAYNAVPGQTDDNPTETASGAYTHPEVVAARSVDLKDELPWGTVIAITKTGTTTPSCGINQVKGLIGYRVIADSMHPRKRQQIDILLDQGGGNQKNPALILGMCKGIEITVVGKIDIKDMPATQAELKAMIGKDTAQELARK